VTSRGNRSAPRGCNLRNGGKTIYIGSLDHLNPFACFLWARSVIEMSAAPGSWSGLLFSMMVAEIAGRHPVRLERVPGRGMKFV
jgi:hypothetical protein